MVRLCIIDLICNPFDSPVALKKQVESCYSAAFNFSLMILNFDKYKYCFMHNAPCRYINKNRIKNVKTYKT